MKQRQCQVSVDLDAIRHNYDVLKKSAPNSKAIAVIKADAYGHGAVSVAQALSSGHIQADAFAVATVNEAVHLRKHNITKRIIVLGGFLNQTELEKVIGHELDPVVHSDHQIELLLSSEAHHLNLWLKVNTGMGRLGFNLHEIHPVLQQLDHFKNIRMITHLANADDKSDPKTQQQLEKVKQLQLADYEWSIANSAGTQGYTQAHKQWVRLGISLYGINPFDGYDNTVCLKHAMSFSSKLMAVYQRQKGDSVGYGGTYQCLQDMRIGIVAVGYGDGYPRHIAQGAKVLIQGQLVAIIGRVSMDMLTVDLTTIEQAQIGETVILWNDQLSVEQVADNCETIAYELCCNVGAHNPIQYLNK